MFGGGEVSFVRGWGDHLIILSHSHTRTHTHTHTGQGAAAASAGSHGCVSGPSFRCAVSRCAVSLLSLCSKPPFVVQLAALSGHRLCVRARARAYVCVPACLHACVGACASRTATHRNKHDKNAAIRMPPTAGIRGAAPPRRLLVAAHQLLPAAHLVRVAGYALIAAQHDVLLLRLSAICSYCGAARCALIAVHRDVFLLRFIAMCSYCGAARFVRRQAAPSR